MAYTRQQRESSDAEADGAARDHRMGARSPIIGICFYTLGGFTVTRHDESGESIQIPASAWRHGRALALAHYLLCKPQFVSSRAALRDELWPRVEPSLANSHLSNALWNVRKALGVARDDSAFLRVTEAEVRLVVAPARRRDAAPALGSGVWIDAVEFEAAARQVKSFRDPRERLREALHALTLYHGDFLPSCAEPLWSVARRERLHVQWAETLLLTAQAQLEVASAEDALETLDRLLSAAPDHEEGAVMALTLLMERNRDREARALYERLRTYYRATYRRPPPASLQEMVHSVPRRVSAPIPRGA